MKKRWISLLLTVLLAVSLLPLGASAAEAPTRDELFAAMGSTHYTAAGVELFAENGNLVAVGGKGRGRVELPIAEFSRPSLYLSSNSYYVQYAGDTELLTIAFLYESGKVSRLTVVHSSFAEIPCTPSVYLPGHHVQIADSKNGSVEPAFAFAAPDEAVPISVQADEGYVLAALKAKDASGAEIELRTHSSGSVYYMTMPDSDVTITAEFENTDDTKDVDAAFAVRFFRQLVSSLRSLSDSVRSLFRSDFAGSGSRVAEALGKSFR